MRNIFVIMADQIRYDVLDNPDVILPNLRRLRDSGICMDRFYANTPVCVPSRCSLLTGKFVHSHAIRQNHTVLEENRHIHLFRAAKQAGYQIAYSGKNHVLTPGELGRFDFAITEETARYTPEQQLVLDFKHERERFAGSYGYRCAAPYPYPAADSPAEKFTTELIEALDGFAGPFCAMLSILEPHYPHAAPREIWDMYDESTFPLPDILPNDIMEKPLRYGIKQAAQHATEATEAEIRNYLHCYYAMLTLFDRQVGRVVDYLQARGIWEDTLLMVTSDHGEFAFHHGMYKKDLVLIEDLLHIPLLAHGPELIGGRYTAPAQQVDILPTILQWAELPIPKGVQGDSLIPLWQGASPVAKPLFAEICLPQMRNPYQSYSDHVAYSRSIGRSDPPFNIPGDFTKSIMTSDWRYVWYAHGEEELYDLKADPGCCCNLAADKALGTQKLQLKVQLLEWNALSEDPLDPALIAQLHTQYDAWNSPVQGNPIKHAPWDLFSETKQNIFA